jgi:splicing suppressor protein 51
VLRDDVPLPPDWQAYASSVQAPHRNAKHGELERAFFQHSLSIPLTIVAALDRFGLRSKYTDRTDKKDLAIHLIGAEVEFELMSVGFVYEEITHLLPGVKRLRIVFVGPSLNVENETVQEQECCPVCQEDERSRMFECRKYVSSCYLCLALSANNPVSLLYRRSTYHDFMRKHKPSPPDLAVAFNSGMHEEPEKWSHTLSVLLANRTPTVLTSYNAIEAADDARVVTRKAGARVEWIWKEEPNKWKSGRDHFDVTSPSGFWSENQYWMGWRGA